MDEKATCRLHRMTAETSSRESLPNGLRQKSWRPPYNINYECSADFESPADFFFAGKTYNGAFSYAQDNLGVKKISASSTNLLKVPLYVLPETK